jgi:hypothetical protein
LAETDPARWQNDLQRAYVAKTVPTCLCTRQRVPMYIARLGDVHVLKRRPNTGHEHHPDCESHGGISQAAHLMYTAEAINERPDGKVAHTLSVPLSTIEHARLDITLDEAAAPPRPDQHTKRTSMTLRGFLNLLWEESGLSTWSPRMVGKRRLSLVYWRLREALLDRVIGELDAHQLVYIPETTKGPDADARARWCLANFAPSTPPCTALRCASKGFLVTCLYGLRMAALSGCASNGQPPWTDLPASKGDAGSLFQTTPTPTTES